VLSSLEALESAVRWRGKNRPIVYALFAKHGFAPDVEEAAATRDDLRLFTPGDVLDPWSVTHG